MKLSAVITTRNEESNIANCIRSFDGRRGDVEVIVVDNSSTDRTKEIAASLGAVVTKMSGRGRSVRWSMALSMGKTSISADRYLRFTTAMRCPTVFLYT